MLGSKDILTPMIPGLRRRLAEPPRLTPWHILVLCFFRRIGNSFLYDESMLWKKIAASLVKFLLFCYTTIRAKRDKGAEKRRE